MDGWWTVNDLPEMLRRLFASGEADTFSQFWSRVRSAQELFMNFQSKVRAKIVANEHYDLGNDFYRLWLDETMAYTCGYWNDSVSTLKESQYQKYDLICRKLGYKPGERVLDIGCGWGGFAKFAAEQYGVRVVGVTISREQAVYARQYCRGLPIEIRIQDYRDIADGPYDHVTIVGMLEHVGCRNYPAIFQKVSDVLRPGGNLMTHLIGTTYTDPVRDPWFHRYIFPNGELPDRWALSKASAGVLSRVDFHEFPADYYPRTLRAWYDNFVAAWPEVQKLDTRFDERFYRMWEYYLLSMVAAFEVRRNVLWQIVWCRETDTQAYRDYVPVR